MKDVLKVFAILFVGPVIFMGIISLCNSCKDEDRNEKKYIKEALINRINQDCLDKGYRECWELSSKVYKYYTPSGPINLNIKKDIWHRNVDIYYCEFSYLKRDNEGYLQEIPSIATVIHKDKCPYYVVEYKLNSTW